VVKPFGMNELLAHLRTAVRRHDSSSSGPVVTTKAFTIE
jgi:DNA-binding response OmpR family regulator